MATVCEATLDSPYSKKDGGGGECGVSGGVSKRDGEEAAPPRSLTSPLRAKIESDNAFGGSPELPPIVRALAEDAKGMRARLKRYRDERDRGEKTLIAQRVLCAKLQDKIIALESALAKFVNGATRETALRELRKARTACELIDAAEAKATDASKRATIERKSKEADSKKHRRAMLLLEREREDERREHEKTRAALFDKDREARAFALRIRTLAKKLKDANDAVAAATLQKDTLEGRCTTPGTAEDVVELEVEAPVDAPEAVPEEEEEEAPLALEAVASPAAVPAPPQTQTPPIVVNIVIEPVERAHVMLCLIHDDAPATRIESESPLAPPPPAALIAEDEKEDETPPSPPPPEETKPKPPPPTDTGATPAAESPRVREQTPAAARGRRRDRALARETETDRAEEARLGAEKRRLELERRRGAAVQVRRRESAAAPRRRGREDVEGVKGAKRNKARGTLSRVQIIYCIVVVLLPVFYIHRRRERRRAPFARAVPFVRSRATP